MINTCKVHKYGHLTYIPGLSSPTGLAEKSPALGGAHILQLRKQGGGRGQEVGGTAGHKGGVRGQEVGGSHQGSGRN